MLEFSRASQSPKEKGPLLAEGSKQVKYTWDITGIAEKWQ